MDSRRLPFLLLLVLLPAPARADRHFTECFLGFSTEKQASLALRGSCGIRLVATEYTTPDIIPPAPDAGRGGALLSANSAWGAQPESGTGGTRTTKGKSTLFLVAETAEYVLGRDSGHSVDAWMLGLRYIVHGQGNVEPFVHAMGGRQRPARRNAIADDDDLATDWAAAAAVGGGVDIEIDAAQKSGIVPVMRLQFDLVESGATSGFHPYGRATFGLSFRFEKPHK